MIGNEQADSDGDREALVGRLRELGLRFLAPSDAEPKHLSSLPEKGLIERLALRSDPRLRFSLVPLLILHPDWAIHVQWVVQQMSEPARSELQALYAAAVYLQRFWHTRLGLYMGDFEALPDLYSAVLGLPSANERHGKAGLHALGAWHASCSPQPFNRLASYHRMMDLLFEQLKIETKGSESPTTG